MDLDIDLLPWQNEVWNSPARWKVVAAGRRTGKSRLAAYLLLYRALQAKKGQVFYVAPTLGQARDIMWHTLLDVGQGVISSSHINNLQVTTANGTIISLRSADRTDNLRGVSLAYCVLDEFASMSPDIWELILRPALVDIKGSGGLFIGTPQGRNHFHELYTMAMTTEDEEWAGYHFTSYDNTLIDEKEINRAKQSMSSYAFRQEFMASFEARGSEIFKEEWVQFSSEEPDGDYYVSIDLAGFAEEGKRKAKAKHHDNSAIAIVKVSEQGWWVKEIIYGRWSLKETAAKIFKAVADYQPLAVGIERGIARDAVLSPLKDLMKANNRYFRIETLTHGNRNKTERIMWALQGRFENGLITINPGDWNAVFLDELYQFPDPLTHDDTVDALAYIDQLAEVSYFGEISFSNDLYTDRSVGY